VERKDKAPAMGGHKIDQFRKLANSAAAQKIPFIIPYSHHSTTIKLTLPANILQ